MADLERLQPLCLRVNPESDYQQTHDLTVDALVDYIEQLPADEQPIELAMLIYSAAKVLEAKAGPVEAARYQAMGFYSVSQVQHQAES
jgi:hypothetical protein